MYNTIYAPIINTKCPAGMTKATCPVVEYIQKENPLFHLSLNETVLDLNKPYNENRAEYNQEFAKINSMCEECKKAHTR